MLEEYDSIMRNDVWEVVPRPVGKSIVTSRWLYKTKYCCRWKHRETHGPICGARILSGRGVDYDETFAPVARYTSIRSIFAIAAEMGWRIH
jgi:hypothetical protein